MAQDVNQFQDEVNNRIRYFQNQYVILDSDLAHFFHVETKVLNQAAQRNSKRFPTEFRFQISETDFNSLKSQIVTSKGGNAGSSQSPSVINSSNQSFRSITS